MSTAPQTEHKEAQANQMTESQAQQKERDETQMTMQKKNLEILVDILNRNQSNELESSRAPLLSKKKKALNYKVRAGILLMSLAKNFLNLGSNVEQPLKIDYNEAENMRKLAKLEEEEENDLLIKMDGPIPQDIKNRVKISDKTKKIISDFQKSRFNTKRAEE